MNMNTILPDKTDDYVYKRKQLILQEESLLRITYLIVDSQLGLIRLYH